MSDLTKRIREQIKGVTKSDGFDYLVPAKDIAAKNAALKDAAEALERIEKFCNDYLATPKVDISGVAFDGPVRNALTHVQAWTNGEAL